MIKLIIFFYSPFNNFNISVIVLAFNVEIIFKLKLNILTYNISYMESFMIVGNLIISILIFTLLFIAGKVIYNKLNDSNSRFLNPLEYFPEEEFQTLKQVFYLIIMLIFFVFILYIMVFQGEDFIGIAFVQVLVSLYVAFTLDYSSWKNRILFFMLIPYEAISYIVLGQSVEMFSISIMHILVYAYMMIIYFGKFRKFTETNSLGITIMLLFSIIFGSFLLTSIVEGVTLLDALVMVSNAFTSNGYAILGTSDIGKLNALLLVWGGYTISGVGTATLTAAILIKHNNKREKELNERLDKLESLIKDNKK